MPLAPVRNRARTSQSSKSRSMRRAWLILAIITSLILLIVGLFLLWLWLNKPQVAGNKALDAPSQPRQQLTTHKPPANTPIGSTIQSISSPIAPGGNASLTLRTTESAVCNIKVVHLDDKMNEVARVTDSGLGDKKADDFGVVMWSWTMPAGAAIATWHADITCTRGDKSTRSLGDIVVKR